MVKQKSVTVAWQVVFTFIPFVDLWAFYRIQKLGLYLVIIYGGQIITYIILGNTFGFNGSLMEMPDVSSNYISILSVIIAFHLLAIYLVVTWSRDWNRKFSQ